MVADRDWLSDLTETIGPPEGWLPAGTRSVTEQLAEDEERDAVLSRLDRPLEQLAEAVGRKQPEDQPGEEGGDPGAPEPATGPVASPPRPAPAAETAWPSSASERLARIEALLAADLDALGPAVLAETIESIQDRLRLLAEQVDDASLAIITLSNTLPAAWPPANGGPGGTGAEEQLAALDAKIDGLAEQVRQAVEVLVPDPATGVRQAEELAALDDLGRRLERVEGLLVSQGQAEAGARSAAADELASVLRAVSTVARGVRIVEHQLYVANSAADAGQDEVDRRLDELLRRLDSVSTALLG